MEFNKLRENKWFELGAYGLAAGAGAGIVKFAEMGIRRSVVNNLENQMALVNSVCGTNLQKEQFGRLYTSDAWAAQSNPWVASDFFVRQTSDTLMALLGTMVVPIAIGRFVGCALGGNENDRMVGQATGFAYALLSINSLSNRFKLYSHLLSAMPKNGFGNLSPVCKEARNIEAEAAAAEAAAMQMARFAVEKISALPEFCIETSLSVFLGPKLAHAFVSGTMQPNFAAREVASIESMQHIFDAQLCAKGNSSACARNYAPGGAMFFGGFNAAGVGAISGAGSFVFSGGALFAPQPVPILAY